MNWLSAKNMPLNVPLILRIERENGKIYFDTVKFRSEGMKRSALSILAQCGERVRSCRIRLKDSEMERELLRILVTNGSKQNAVKDIMDLIKPYMQL